MVRLVRLCSLILCVLFSAAAQSLPSSYVVGSIAGSGHGDSGPALSAILDGPFGLAQDADGNVYISESGAGVIRRVRPDGTIERFAGTGIIGDTADGSAALQTNLSAPSLIMMDRDGGLIFADSQTCRIRKVKKDGTIQDLVGTGSCTLSGGFGGGFGGGGSDGTGPETQVSGIGGMVLDSAGLLIFSDQNKNLIRRVDADGIVRIIAGTGALGFYGDDGAATFASLSRPAGLVFDGSGNLYVGDGTNCRVRRIDTDGNIKTVAGTATCATTSTSFTVGIATGRSLGRIGALAYDPNSGSILISSPSIYRVVRLALGEARLYPFFGNGRLGASTSTDPLAFNVNEASSMLVATDGGVLVAAGTSFQVYSVKDGVVSGFAGAWPQLDQYPPAPSAPIVRPAGLAMNPDGTLLIVDAGAERLLQFQGPDQLSAVAGARYPTGFSLGDNGPAIKAALNGSNRVARGPDGVLYISQATSIRSIGTDGVIRTAVDFLGNPVGIVVDPQGRLVYSDAGANRIFRYDPMTKSRTVIAGTGAAGFSGDGAAATDALLNSPGDIVFDSQGNLLVADRVNRRVRSIAPDGTIQTVIGSTRGFSYIDTTGEVATDVGFSPINGIAIDSSDNIYVAEPLRISVISTDGYVRILTGFVSEDDNGKRSYLNGPIDGVDGLAVGRDGRVYFSLRQDGRVMVLGPPPPASRRPRSPPRRAWFSAGSQGVSLCAVV